MRNTTRSLGSVSAFLTNGHKTDIRVPDNGNYDLKHNFQSRMFHVGDYDVGSILTPQSTDSHSVN
jgi:hypothetical protein